MQRKRPSAVAFDVMETVFSLDALGKRFVSTGLPAGAVKAWFARFLRDAFALNAAGIYRPFREVAAGTLEVFLAEDGAASVKGAVDGLLETFAALDPHPDVAPALELLERGGIRVIALTNGSAENTERLFSRAGLRRRLEAIISVDAVKRWKPAREVYLHAAGVVGVPPPRMALVAAHAWDILGAAEAGFTTAWVSRGGAAFPSFMGAPDVRGGTLVEVVEGLLGLPAE